MFRLAKALPRQELILEAAPVLLTSFLIAEAFYKFKSFTLECLAFLATWAVLDAIEYVALRRWRAQRG